MNIWSIPHLMVLETVAVEVVVYLMAQGLHLVACHVRGDLRLQVFLQRSLDLGAQGGGVGGGGVGRPSDAVHLGGTTTKSGISIIIFKQEIWVKSLQKMGKPNNQIRHYLNKNAGHFNP